jgi:hypothetical protein
MGGAFGPGHQLRCLTATDDKGKDVSMNRWFDTVKQGVNVSGLGYAGTRSGYFDRVSSSQAYLDYGQMGPSRPKNLFRITNAGRTSTATGVVRCDDVSGLVFTDANHGLAICDHFYELASTYLVGTSDGGATWSRATSFFERF